MPDAQAGFRKRRGTGGHIWKEILADGLYTFFFQKKIFLCFIGYIKAFDCVECGKQWGGSKKKSAPEHLIVLLHHLDCGQEANVKIKYGETNGIS